VPLPASAPLIFAHPSRCVKTIHRGMVKRCLAGEGSHLVAYQVSCPNCGFVGSYLPEESGFVEGVWIVDQGEPKPGAKPMPFRHPSTLDMEKPVVCYACRGTLRVHDGIVEVRAAGT
jgi:hypothetical protein